MSICIDDQFDGGNIRVVTAPYCPENNDSALHAELQIKKDTNAEFLQWFYFKVSGAEGKMCHFEITNAHAASYKDGFVNYMACASYDKVHWFRIETTSFDMGTLSIKHMPECPIVYYAYFAPYSLERHSHLIASSTTHPLVTNEILGRTIQGRTIDYLRIGLSTTDKPNLWIIARQHPGETMAEHWMEGLIERLLDDSDPVARWLQQNVVFHLVPNMNPDGSYMGHLRTNAHGTNLNRAWLEPTTQDSPEVYYVQQKMHNTGVDFFADIHGDENLPYNFLVGTQGIPSWTAELQTKFNNFQSTLAQLTPDFQVNHGYPVAAPGKGNMTLASNWVAEQFKCLAVILEQPFKDTANNPYPSEGWSPARAKHLADAFLQTIYHTLTNK